ncbi:unnamed protein product [Lactuca virosa]|uniref:Uncharacterized protein n=1 Tax=Lactuca virosa TaxID=75947 RepID=A0AAU9MLM1_9ASTR|nr:unnamed protein product [Lactuca virosa]
MVGAVNVLLPRIPSSHTTNCRILSDSVIPTPKNDSKATNDESEQIDKKMNNIIFASIQLYIFPKLQDRVPAYFQEEGVIRLKVTEVFILEFKHCLVGMDIGNDHVLFSRYRYS